MLELQFCAIVTGREKGSLVSEPAKKKGKKRTSYKRTASERRSAFQEGKSCESGLNARRAIV